MRIAGGVLIVGTAAAVVGCAPATERPTTPATAAAASEHPSETLTSLIHQALPNIQGKTLTSATVTVPPGARAVPHRHGNAFVYACVLEGEPMRTCHQGENWIEQPGAHHVATENRVWRANPAAARRLDSRRDPLQQLAGPNRVREVIRPQGER
jgi:quercetin dioxygenase-like cupin family protein